jgi:serine/threonine-protein kinase
MSAPVVVEVLEGVNRGARYTFEHHATFLAGRAKKCHLHIIDDRYFSRHHFLLEILPPYCHLRDLGSRNGTKVNDIRVDEIDLRGGDLITGGRMMLRVSLPMADPPLASAPQMPNDPEVPGFEPLQLLHESDRARVYRARRHADGRGVALKLLLPRGPVTEQAGEEFLQVATRLCRLNHRRLVRCREVGRVEGRFFQVTDYVETVNPRELLADLRPKPAVRTACGLVCQALEALHRVHEQGFVHRNLRPSNLLVHWAGRKLRAQVSDAGVARAFEDAGLAGMTRQGDVRDALAFQAPEQILDCRHARPAADVYAAGATLYYLLTGTPPHDLPPGKDPHAILLEKDPVPIAEHRPELPAGLAELIHTALARRARRRFESAAEMFHALLPYGQGRPGRL